MYFIIHRDKKEIEVSAYNDEKLFEELTSEDYKPINFDDIQSPYGAWIIKGDIVSLKPVQIAEKYNKQ